MKRTPPTGPRALARRACLALLALGLAAAPAARAEDLFVRAVFEPGATLQLEVADTPERRMVGLMGRKSLPEGWGMLFVFPSSQYLSFWMKNTLVPLAIAFLDEEGKILNIRHMRPLDETTRHRSRRKARYAIEVPDGWFAEHGVRAGQRVQLLQKQLLVGEPRPRMPGVEMSIPVEAPGPDMVPLGPPVTIGGPR